MPPPLFLFPAFGNPYGSRNGVRTELGQLLAPLDRAITKTRVNRGFSSISFLPVSGIVPAITPSRVGDAKRKTNLERDKPRRKTMKIQSKIKAGRPYIKT